MVLEENDAEIFRDWSPIRIYWHANQPFVDWCWMEKTRFTEPFFDMTIQKRLRLPFNQLFRPQTPLEFLGELHEKRKGIAPTGFIFHISRCGSTLVSQMLAALAQNIVISEPPLIDAILRLRHVSEEQRIEWLRWLLNAFAQPRIGEQHFFVKFDSWNSLDLALVKRAFPDVPWIFLYRNPVEVIVSHKRQPGAQMIPGQIQQFSADFDFQEVLQMPLEEYCARILAKMCANVLPFADDADGIFINYDELPEAVFTKVIKHFRLAFTEEDLQKMHDAARFNAKTPRLNFTPDAEEKRREATEIALTSAEKFVNPLYEKLENLRKKSFESRL